MWSIDKWRLWSTELYKSKLTGNCSLIKCDLNRCWVGSAESKFEFNTTPF